MSSIRKFHFAIIFAIILLGCTSERKSDRFKFDFNGTSTIRFHVSNSTDTSYHELLYFNLLPLRQDKKEIAFAGDGIYCVELQHSYPVEVHVVTNNRLDVACFMLTNDTLDVFYDASKRGSAEKAWQFKGKTGLISKYLSYSKFYITAGRAPKKDQTVEAYNALVDSIKAIALDSLKQFRRRSELPDWYCKYESGDINFQSANLKLMQYGQRRWMHGQNIEKPMHLIESFKLDLKDNVGLSWDFLSLMFSMRPLVYDTLLGPGGSDEVFFQYSLSNIKTAQKFLTKEQLAYLVAVRAGILIEERRLLNYQGDALGSYQKRIDSFLVVNDQYLKADSTIRNFILKYKDKQFEKRLAVNLLKKGDKAPGFFLKNPDDETVRLSDFKGNNVLLNFWATYCHSCLASISQKNELGKKYADQGFVVVNICMDNNEARWQEIIQEKKFEGVQLRCQGNWKDMLMDRYNIQGLGHYCLVDAEGNVFENKVESDLEATIKTLLNI